MCVGSNYQLWVMTPLSLHPAPQIADLVAAGKVRLEVALNLPLAQAAEAHEQVATGHTRGKVVLTP